MPVSLAVVSANGTHRLRCYRPTGGFQHRWEELTLKLNFLRDINPTGVKRRMSHPFLNTFVPVGYRDVIEVTGPGYPYR